MKKIKYLLLLLVVLLVSCTNNNTTTEENKLNIVTSFYPVYLFTQNVVGDATDIEITNLTGNTTGCLHGYNLTTANMKALENADMFIINGAGMEDGFIESIKENYPELNIVDTSIDVDVVNSEFEDEYNPHIWLSLTNAEKQINEIYKAIVKLDIENEEKYLKNTQDYISKIKELKNYARESLYGKEEVNVVTMHEAFTYFAEDIGINVVDVIQKDEDESPTPKQLIEIVDNIKNNNVKAIFIEPQYSDKVATLLKDETGVPIYTVDSIVTGSGNKTEYLEKMKSNVDTIISLVTK